MSLESLIAYLWNPSIDLKKQGPKFWKRLDVYKTEKKEGETISYLDTTFITNSDRKLQQIIAFNKDGKQVDLSEYQYPDDLTETSITINRMGESKDIQRFNKVGFLIEEISLDPWGDTETTKYFYDEKNNLEKIIQKDEDTYTVEDFIYKDGKLHKIETSNDDGVSLFRGFIYDKKGLLEKVIRMQHDFVNMEEKYFYNEKDQLIREIHEAVNRLKDGKTPMMMTEFDYHPNGKKKTESFKMIDTYEGKTKLESTEFFNKNGLLLKQVSHDYKEETETIYEYRYE